MPCAAVPSICRPRDPLHRNQIFDDSTEKNDYDTKNPTATHIEITRPTATIHMPGQMQSFIMKLKESKKTHSTVTDYCFRYGIAVLRTKIRKSKGSIFTYILLI